jgi:hypothetical protein
MIKNTASNQKKKTPYIYSNLKLIYKGQNVSQ